MVANNKFGSLAKAEWKSSGGKEVVFPGVRSRRDNVTIRDAILGKVHRAVGLVCG